MVVAVLEDGGRSAGGGGRVSWSGTLNGSDWTFRVILRNVLVQIFFGAVARRFFFFVAVRVVWIARIAGDVSELTFVAC